MDEAILIARNERLVPDTLHLYRRTVPTISLGHFEKAASCVDLEAAERLGVQLVRRMSGGSAIYTDPEQLIYSVVVGRDSVPESPNETFALLCRGLIDALGALGVKAAFKPINDVLVEGKKISGSAQIRRYDVVMQQGTLLVRTDYERMFAVLRSNKRSRESMTSLSEVLAEVPSMDMIKQAIVAGFSSSLGVAIEAGELSDHEKELTERLVRTKYGTREHTYLY